MRNLLATVPHGAREAIAAIVRTIFAQPDHASALAQLRKVADGLRARFPRPRRSSRRRPKTSWPTGTFRSSISASSTARIRSSG
jgi:transposase-like protein